MANIAVIVPVLLLALFVNEGESVQCWTCSSDLDPTCNDPYWASRPDSSYRYALTNCDANAGATYPYLTTSKSVCKKDKKYINGQLIVSRGCTWKRSDDYSTTCPATSSLRHDSIVFCETCDSNACNSATSIGKALALLVAPLSLLLFK